jgi:NRAMP (natural resistance-associated macrophage protein)-like metal ion transporter
MASGRTGGPGAARGGAAKGGDAGGGGGRITLRRFLKALGPGLITGAADDDPSGIGTYSVAGAALGLAMLWTALLTLPLMVVVQYTCAKIGMVSGRGLAGVLRQNYPRWLLYFCVAGLVVANTINAGANVGAVAAAVNLLAPVPVAALVVPVALGLVALQVWGSYRLIERVFKWLSLSLFAYVAAAFLSRPHWGEVLRTTFLPPVSASGEYLTTLVAILGTTISPYLFFWQASEEVEEEVSQGRTTVRARRGATDAELRWAKLDTLVGMIFCHLVFYFVVLAAATTLHAAGKTDVGSATDAAKALEPLAGPAAKYLFAAGIIGAGVLAIPVLTGASAYAVAETFGWRSGLDEKPGRAKQFYAVIAASTLLGTLINFVGVNPIKALYWTAVINGVIAPPLLVVLLLVANNPKVMGRRTNGRFANAVGWFTAALMTAAAVGMFLTWGS